jgi:hypothetical protein
MMRSVRDGRVAPKTFIRPVSKRWIAAPTDPVSASVSPKASPETPIQCAMVRWRNRWIAARPAASAGSAATSHSVSKPNDRLFRFVEPMRSIASS